MARLRAMWLIVLFVWVTRSLPAIRRLRSRGRLAGDVAATGTPRRAEMSSAECRLRSASSVARVTFTGLVEPYDLGQDVVDPGRLDDRADRAAGDDAGALARRA